MSRRNLAYIGVAVALLALGRLLWSGGSRSPSSPGAPSAEDAGATAREPLADAALEATALVANGPLERPPSAVAEYGVLSDRDETALRAAIDRETLAALVAPRLCGESAACDAVRATLRDEHATTLEVLASSDWNLAGADVDAGARGLSAGERARVTHMPRVVVVHVAGPAAAGALPLRTAIAATAAIAARVDGIVWDQLLARFERPRDFAAHAVTTPLDAPTFRRDRVELLYEPNADGTVRMLTAGLSRWGAPDVEAAAVPGPAAESLAKIVVDVAATIANGAQRGPIALGADQQVDVASVHPHDGDPNDFMARIEPPAGDGAMGYLDLAERVFGPVLAAAPDAAAVQAQRSAAQAKLTAALARLEAVRGHGGELLVRVPFAIPGDAGTESMWLAVTGYDARTVTGTLVDDPLGATDVARGDLVTRPRADVEDVTVRGARDE